MPQIEQIQVVHWGPLLPDPVDLATDGINVATGPNGSGKTTFLDAVKLMLGVDDLGRRPAEYIFDGGGDPGLRAGRALVKATFANPERPGRSGRLFSDVGRGCELAGHVTAICEVSREGRRYVVLPGYIAWGGQGRTLEEDLRRVADVPSRDWMRPKLYSELMARAGVSRALLGVISLKQGETDRAIEGAPEMLLRRVLELTGKQSTLEEFRDAKSKLIEAKRQHAEAAQLFRAEKGELARLELIAQRYDDFMNKRTRLQHIEEVELPAARHTAMRAQRAKLASERDGLKSRVAQAGAELKSLESDIPALQIQHEDAAGKITQMQDEAKVARGELMHAAGDAREASNRLADAGLAIKEGQALAQTPGADAVSRSEHVAAAAERSLGQAELDRENSSHDLAELRTGRPLRPDGLDAFREFLSDHGIESQLVAEHVEAPNGIAAEAALADGVWTLVVPPGQLEEALALAIERGHRLPIAAEGQGTPVGALAGVVGMPTAGAYLEEVAMPIGIPGVDMSGVVRGRAWGAYRAPARPVLGTEARESAIRQLEDQLAALDDNIPRLRAEAQRSRQKASTVRLAVKAISELKRLETAASKTSNREQVCKANSERIEQELANIGPAVGKLGEELREKNSRMEILLRRDVPQFEARLETYNRDVEQLDVQLEATSLTPEQASAEDLQSVDWLESQRDLLSGEIADVDRFPEEVRSEVVLAYREEQKRTVEEVEGLLEGRQQDLDNVATEVDRAKKRYDAHLREVIDQLSRQFREVCEQAGMEGVIERVPSEVEGEFGIDVKVAHAPGEPKRSYRSRAHSGGQRAKISILLLLAAMGLEGAADLLIMDEHVAHLDSRNIEFVAQVMTALKDRVQFILATPTNAESLRQGWCDHQVSFYAREPGEPYAPAVKLLTREPEGRRYAAMGQMSLAD